MSIEKRLERIEAILDARGLDWDHPRVEDDHFAGANKMVVEEPAKEAEHPASEKPPEPEYREPVLPADAGKVCEFSDDGQSWLSGWVYGWVPGRNWVTLHNNSRKYCRIKKDA